MATNASEPRIYIEAVDNDKVRRNLTCTGWQNLTGKCRGLIANHRRQKKNGRNLTNRQIVGLDKVPIRKSGAKVSAKVLSQRDEIINSVLYRKLA